MMPIRNLERRVRLTVEFRVSFREITAETLREVYAGTSNLEEMLQDPSWLEDMGRQGRLLRALLRDEEALRRFTACAVVGEIASCEGERLRKELGVRSEEEVLWQVIESLEGEDAEFYAGVWEEGKFREYLELIFYSTPVECVGAQIREADEGEASRGSDNHVHHGSALTIK